MATIKMGDKLFVVTRRDISPGYQGVQSQHALRQFTAEHPERDAEWFKNSNYLAWLSVEDEVELMRLITSAQDIGLRWSAFREPDVGGQITAIAIEPHPKAAELCRGLPLALRELNHG
jgi:peptidyl-tRNA hydrolase